MWKNSRIFTDSPGNISRSASRGDDRHLRLRFACDALGADPPDVIEHEILLQTGATVALPEARRTTFEMDGQPHTSAAAPLHDLVRIALNAILYATSAGPEVERRSSPATHGSRASEAHPVSSESVFFLPGTIDIGRLRKYQDLGRSPGGGQLLHRFMVRGHWRRAARNYADQRVRWIAPHWRGPDLAAVIERAHALKP